jgi:hypothetical protein
VRLSLFAFFRTVPDDLLRGIPAPSLRRRIRRSGFGAAGQLLFVVVVVFVDDDDVVFVFPLRSFPLRLSADVVVVVRFGVSLALERGGPGPRRGRVRGEERLVVVVVAVVMGVVDDVSALQEGQQGGQVQRGFHLSPLLVGVSCEKKKNKDRTVRGGVRRGT